MSITTKILHICDHNIIQNIFDNNKEVTITRSDKYDFDVVDSEGIIYKINKIVQGENIFIKDIDYEIFTHNRIRWIGIIKPKPLTQYKVYYDTISRTTRRFDPYDCPRCQGNGWYVSMLDNNPDNFLKANGAMKLVQDYVKLLLTIKNNNLGTNLLTLTTGEMYDPQLIANEIAISIRDAEEQHKLLQLQMLETDTPLSDDERLYKVEIVSIDFDEANTGFIVELKLYNYNGDFSNINLKV